MSNSANKLRLSKILMGMPAGKGGVFSYPDMTTTEVANTAKSCAKSHGFSVVVSAAHGGVRVEKTQSVTTSVINEILNEMEFDQTAAFEMSPVTLKTLNAESRKRKTAHFDVVVVGTVIEVSKWDIGGSGKEEKPSRYPVETISRYPEVDVLNVGESHLFKFLGKFHKRIRIMAESRNKEGCVRLVCSIEAGGIRVTRLPLPKFMENGCIHLEALISNSSWGMEKLDTQSNIHIEAHPRYHSRVRQAAQRYATLNDCVIRCRIQDDGSMLVYRVPEAVAAE